MWLILLLNSYHICDVYSTLACPLPTQHKVCASSISRSKVLLGLKQAATTKIEYQSGPSLATRKRPSQAACTSVVRCCNAGAAAQHQIPGATSHLLRNVAPSTAFSAHRTLHLLKHLGLMLAGFMAGDLLPQYGHLPLQLTAPVLCKA